MRVGEAGVAAVASVARDCSPEWCSAAEGPCRRCTRRPGRTKSKQPCHEGAPWCSEQDGRERGKWGILITP